MRLIADLHIHSHYSRATSRNLNLEHLHKWAQLKGVHVVGTGDISHPGWLEELRTKLEPAGEGLFRLRPEFAAPMDAAVPPACRNPVRFLLAGEISNIYKKHGKVRKVHNVICAPALDAVARIQARLERIGNIRADGRPILGLDSRDLLEIILEVDPQCHLIPAHIWTPWFSLLGANSGFDAVEECFGDLTSHIFALETGLSSDPPMNWRISALDRYTLVSNSDAHSPQKLAREATIFDIAPSYTALFAALRSGDPAHFRGTIEFFPEEGKYHHDGHRKCGISWTPQTTLAHDGLCTVCGKPVTVGVLHRVEVLADCAEGRQPARRHPYRSLIPLPEILAELHGAGAGAKVVQQAYDRLLAKLGPELAILDETPTAAIAAVGGERLAAGIARMRRGEVMALAGYDGEYGVIHLFQTAQMAQDSAQIGLFGDALARPESGTAPAPLTETEGAASAELPAGAEDRPHAEPAWGQSAFLGVAEDTGQGADEGMESPDIEGGHGGPPAPVGEILTPEFDSAAPAPLAADTEALLAGLNDEQRAAVACTDAPLLIIAGPGTGKTRTLTHRIAYLVLAAGAPPESVLAITFTHKAATEMAERLAGLLPPVVTTRITVKTFHAFGAQLLREFGRPVRTMAPEAISAVTAAWLPGSQDFVICGAEERERLLRRACPELSTRQVAAALEWISAAKNRLLEPDGADQSDPSDPPTLPETYRRYELTLQDANAVDFDDLIRLPVRLLETNPAARQAVQARYRWISVDEYQDVNAAQVRFLELLAGGGANLCAIGDPDQAIYGFRGADRSHFFAFAQEHPSARTLALSRNYRSTQMILDAANQVIARSPDREALEIWSDFVEQTRLTVYAAPTDKAEAEYVVHQIEQMVGGTSYFSLDSGRVAGTAPGTRSFAEFAVLYRTGAQSRALAEAFDRSGIPYQTVGQTPLTAHQDVRALLACLWLMRRPYSFVHWDTLLNGARARVGPAELRAWLGGCQGRGVLPWNLAWHPPDPTNPSAATDPSAPAEAPPLRPAQQRQRHRPIAELLAGLARRQGSTSVAELVELAGAALIDNGLAADGSASRERFARLARRALEFDGRLDDFLEAVTLQGETDAYDPRADRVALLTLHASKGLEFPVVFIAGCEEGLLPYVRPGHEADAEAGVDEERRLFYVGMTRARQRLILTHAASRTLFGRRSAQAPSRFVADIAAALKELEQMATRPSRAAGPAQVQLGLFGEG